MFIFFLFEVAYSAVAQTSCATLTTQPICEADGYCSWNGASCENQVCYKVDEIAACRTLGALAAVCKSLELDLYSQTIYANVCSENSEPTGKLIPYFSRYQEPTTGFPDKSTDGVTLTLWNTIFPQYGYLSQLYTISILKQTFDQVSLTLDIYLKYQSLLLFDTQNTYSQEMALCHMFQILRDDVTAVKATKIPVISKAWQLMDNLLQRFRIIGSNYTVYYPLYSFQQFSLTRLKADIYGYIETTKFQWTQYTTNGFVQLLSYDLHQFGIWGQLTSVNEFKVYKKDFTIQAIDFTITITFKGDFSTLGISVYLYDRSTMTYSNPGTPGIVCVYDSTTTFETTCTINVVGQSSISYFLVPSSGIQTCASLVRYQCRQPQCSWNGASCVNA